MGRKRRYRQLKIPLGEEKKEGKRFLVGSFIANPLPAEHGRAEPKKKKKTDQKPTYTVAATHLFH